MEARRQGHSRTRYLLAGQGKVVLEAGKLGLGLAAGQLGSWEPGADPGSRTKATEDLDMVDKQGRGGCPKNRTG